MKTRQQWFEDELPADIAAMAIRNTEKYEISFLDGKCSSLENSIIGGFLWKETTQGGIFWEQVCTGNYGQIEYSKEANK